MDQNLNSLPQKVTAVLAKYLDRILPSLSDNWWKSGLQKIKHKMLLNCCMQLFF